MKIATNHRSAQQNLLGHLLPRCISQRLQRAPASLNLFSPLDRLHRFNQSSGEFSECHLFATSMHLRLLLRLFRVFLASGRTSATASCAYLRLRVTVSVSELPISFLRGQTVVIAQHFASDAGESSVYCSTFIHKCCSRCFVVWICAPCSL